MGLIKVELKNYGRRNSPNDIPSTPAVDISNCINFDDGIDIKQSRDGISGVFITVSLPQTFYKEAFRIIRDTFFQYGMYAYGQVTIYRRDKIDVTAWYERGTFELDFTSINIENNQLTIDLIDIDLRSIIQSNRNTKYDINTISWPNSLIVDRLPLNFNREANIVTDIQGGTISTSERGTASFLVIYPQISINTNSKDLNVDRLFIANTKEDVTFSNSVAGHSFISNQTNHAITFHIEYDFYYSGSITQDGVNIVNYTQSEINIYSSTNGPYKLGNISSSSQRYTGFVDVIVGPGGFLAFELFFSFDQYRNGEFIYSSKIENFVKFDISYITKASDDWSGMRCVTLDNMLKRLVMLMSNTTSDVYNVSINWNTAIDPDTKAKILVSAEAIRGFTNPQYHISYNDLQKCLFTLGYVPVYVDRTTLTYVYYETLFSASTNVNLNKSQVNNLTVIGDTENSFTNVSVGYPEKKYESENGIYNVNGTFDFTTGLTLLSEKTFDLVCPFRSDHIGLELLLFDRDKENTSTDTRSDNDIFVFQVVPDGLVPNYRLDPSSSYTFPGSDNPNLILLDAALSPQRLINRWRKYLATSTQLCRFTGTTGNRKAINTEEDLYNNVSISETPFFVAARATMDCIYIDELYNPYTWPGIIHIEYKGKSVSGYLADSSRQFAREETNELELMLSEFPN